METLQQLTEKQLYDKKKTKKRENNSLWQKLIFLSDQRLSVQKKHSIDKVKKMSYAVLDMHQAQWSWVSVLIGIDIVGIQVLVVAVRV